MHFAHPASALNQIKEERRRARGELCAKVDRSEQISAQLSKNCQPNVMEMRVAMTTAWNNTAEDGHQPMSKGQSSTFI